LSDFRVAHAAVLDRLLAGGVAALVAQGVVAHDMLRAFALRRRAVATAFRHGSDLVSGPTTTQWPPPRSATSVEGGDAAQGGPSVTGSARSLTAAQFASARLMYSAEFWRHASIVWDT
jgi:hypothetical protein